MGNQSFKLFYESEIQDAAEANPNVFNEAAWLNNLYVFQNLVDKIGSNVILLGSKSGKFTGEYDDLAYYEWNGGNLQGFHFGRKGSGKSVGAMFIAAQLFWIYKRPLLVFDRFGEYMTQTAPLTEPNAIKNLASFGLKPLGFGDKQKNVSPAYLDNEDATQFLHDLPDLQAIKPTITARSLILQLLGISPDSDSDASKYDAAIRQVDQALLENPRWFSDLEQNVTTINDALERNRKSILLQTNLRNLLAYNYVGARKRFDFKKAFQNHSFINYLSSLRVSGFIPLQVYEALQHYQIAYWRKHEEIEQTAVFSEEHDLVSREGTDKTILKDVYEKVATKERKLSNIYYKITQLPALIPNKELQQADFMLTTRPRDARFAEVFKWINEDENIRKDTMFLKWDDSSPIKQHKLVTAESSLNFYFGPSWGQFHKEKKNILIQKPKIKNWLAW